MDLERSTDQPAESPEAAQAPDFLSHLTALAMQALMLMGELPHPEGAEPSVNLDQAKYLIDTIEMLMEKTKGNLNEGENAEAQTLLYQLRVVFMKKKTGVSS